MTRIATLFLAFMAMGFSNMMAGTVITPSDNCVDRKYSVKPFDELNVSSAIEVKYIQSADNTYGVTVTAPDNVIDHVSVMMTRNRISLSLKPGYSIKGNCKIKAIVKAPALSDVELSAASSFTTDQMNMPGSKVELEADGASSVSVGRLTALSCDIDLSGASSTSIGDAKLTNLDIEISGASKVDVSAVKAKDVGIDASGASTVTVTGSTYQAEVELSGASTANLSALTTQVGEYEAAAGSTINASCKSVVKRRATSGSNINIANI